MCRVPAVLSLALMDVVVQCRVSPEEHLCACPIKSADTFHMSDAVLSDVVLR